MRLSLFALLLAGCPAPTPPLPSDPPAPTLTITYLGNAAVLLEDDTHRVLIDSLLTDRVLWVPLGDDEIADLESGTGAFMGIDVALATHDHTDHFAPAIVDPYLAATEAMFMGPPQVTSRLSSLESVVTTAVGFGEREEQMFGDLRVEVLNLGHFDQFGNDFSGVENVGYIVHIGEKKVLHVGDVEYLSTAFETFNLAAEDIDVLMLPTFNTLLSEENATRMSELVAPESIVAFHLQEIFVEEQEEAARRLFGADVFTEPMQVLQY